jgi:hypothetical protein
MQMKRSILCCIAAFLCALVLSCNIVQRPEEESAVRASERSQKIDRLGSGYLTAANALLPDARVVDRTRELAKFIPWSSSSTVTIDIAPAAKGIAGAAAHQFATTYATVPLWLLHRQLLR